MDIAVGIQLGITAQLGFHPRHQLQRVERLGYVVVGPDVEPQNLVGVLGFGGQDDDGDAAGLAHLQRGTDAV